MGTSACLHVLWFVHFFQYSEGEDCLREVQESKVLMLKSYESHLLKARFLSLCSLYSVLPAKHHIFTLIVGKYNPKPEH